MNRQVLKLLSKLSEIILGSDGLKDLPMWCSLTSSHLVTEVKQHSAWLVCGWVTEFLARYGQIHNDLDDHLSGGPFTPLPL